MALDPEKNFDPITGKFKYDPQWQGPLSGRSFERQTEDAINWLYGAMQEGAATAPSDAIPKAPGTPSPGFSALYSRGDHVHPPQQNISGNAASADQLATARIIELTGDANGEAYFDGSANVRIETSIQNATTSSAGLMSSTDKQKLDGIAAGANAYVLPAATTSTMGGVRLMTSAEITAIINEVFYS